MRAENPEETIDDHSTDESDHDEDAEQDQSDGVTLGKTKEQQPTPKKEEVYNLFKCSMSHSVTSELKLDCKE